jgi:hypothetical protein
MRVNHQETFKTLDSEPGRWHLVAKKVTKSKAYTLVHALHNTRLGLGYHFLEYRFSVLELDDGFGVFAAKIPLCVEMQERLEVSDVAV